MSDHWFYRLLERTIAPAAYVSLFAVALALMRAGHVAALSSGRTHFLGAWTTVLFLGGATGLLFFLVGWLLLYWPGRRRTTPVAVHGDPHDIEESSEIDAVSTLLLAGATLRHLMRVNEVIEVADGYYRHDVTTEWVLPRERDVPASDERVETNDLDREAEGGAPGAIGDSWGDATTSALEQKATTQVPADPIASRPSVTFLVPVMRIARPRLVDNMVVKTASGERLSPCNSDEFAQIVRRIVEYWTKSLTGGTLTKKLSDSIERLVREAQFDTQAVDAEGDAARSDASAASELVACLDLLKPPASWKGRETYWDELHDMLRTFCKAVGDAYMIFVPIEGKPGGRAIVRHLHTRHHQPVVPARRERVRLYLGLRPHNHKLTTQEHLYAQSYHLQFRAPEDQYVFACQVDPYPRKSPRRNLVVAPLEGSGGRDYAHVYVRPFESPVRQPRYGLRIGIDCREKPPGLLGIVAVVAIAQALLIWVVGKFYGTFFPPPQGAKSAQASDVPALLLAVPGLAAAWLGSQFTGARLRATSLATIVGVLVCGAIAILSTAAAVSRSAGSIVGSQLGVAHPIWVFFMFSSWILAFDLTVRMLARTWRFTDRLIHPHEEPAFLA